MPDKKAPDRADSGRRHSSDPDESGHSRKHNPTDKNPVRNLRASYQPDHNRNHS